MTDPISYLLGKKAWGRLALAYVWCLWLGGGFELITGLGWNTWQWWIFVGPMTLLVNLYCYIIVGTAMELRKTQP